MPLCCVVCRHHTDWTAVRSRRSVHVSQRHQHVLHQGHSSPPSVVGYGVPQVLGPILFIMYTADVIRIVERHGLGVHQYADDTQVYMRVVVQTIQRHSIMTLANVSVLWPAG